MEVYQLSCRDAGLPPGIRLGFVLKVYGILGMMLAVSMGITVPFIFATNATLAFFEKHTMLLTVVAAILIAQYVFNMCMACESCCGGSSLLRCYFSLMKTVPLNYLYLATFAGCFGIVVGFFCTQYTATSVLLVFALTFVLVMALTVYAVVTKADFTGCGAYILVMFLGFLLLIVVASFFPAEDALRRVLAGAGAMIFGFIIVYDTQQIFGSASKAFGGGSRAIEYTIDMYAFAAWNLYLDFINFFLQMLQLLGARRN